MYREAFERFLGEAKNDARFGQMQFRQSDEILNAVLAGGEVGRHADYDKAVSMAKRQGLLLLADELLIPAG